MLQRVAAQKFVDELIQIKGDLIPPERREKFAKNTKRRVDDIIKVCKAPGILAKHQSLIYSRKHLREPIYQALRRVEDNQTHDFFLLIVAGDAARGVHVILFPCRTSPGLHSKSKSRTSRSSESSVSTPSPNNTEIDPHENHLHVTQLSVFV